MYKYDKTDANLFEKIVDCYNEVVKIGNTFPEDSEFHELTINTATALLKKGNEVSSANKEAI